MSRRAMSPRGRRRVRGAGLALVGALALGAWPLASVAAAPPAPFNGVEVWQDTELQLPPDVPSGAVATIGYTLWDPAAKAFAEIDGLYVRLHPKTGNAAVSNGVVVNDFPGHATATILVPEGGIGRFEVGLLKGTCWGDRGCAPADVPLAITGTGVPDGAPDAAYVGAFFDPFRGDIVAGRPFLSRVEVYPRGFGWVDVPEPQRLVIAAYGHGEEVARGDIVPGELVPQPFVGRISIPDTGDFQLRLYVPGATEADDWPIPDGTIWIKVIQGGRQTDPPGAFGTPRPGSTATLPPAAATGDGPDAPAETPAPVSLALPIVVGLVVVVGIVALRQLRKEW